MKENEPCDRVGWNGDLIVKCYFVGTTSCLMKFFSVFKQFLNNLKVMSFKVLSKNIQ